MIGFWCKISIELIWVIKHGKMGENHHLWSFLKTYTSRLDLYLYNLGFGRFWPTCTGTRQSCTGTGNALFFYFDQFSYFRHNLLISYPI